MGNAVKVIVAAGAGYVLGRKRKFKLAVALGLYLGAKKMKIKPQDILTGLGREVSELPLVSELTEQSREQLRAGAKDAVDKVVAKWAGDLANSLTERTERLTATAAAPASEEKAKEPEGEEKPPGEEPEAAEEAEEPEAPEEPEAAEEAEEPEAPKKSTTGRRRAKSTNAKKTSRSSTTSTKRGTSGGRGTTTRKRASSKGQSDERE